MSDNIIYINANTYIIVFFVFSQIRGKHAKVLFYSVDYPSLLIKEIERKLDVECRFAIVRGGSMLSLSRFVRSSIPVLFDASSGNNMLTAYIPKDEITTSSNFTKFLNIKRETTENIVVDFPLEMEVSDCLREISIIPSVSSLLLNIEGGKLLVRFHFHHSSGEELSLLLQKYMGKFFDEVIIRPALGIISLIRKKDESVPVSVIVYDIPAAVYTDPLIVPILKEGTIAELSNDTSKTGVHRVILYTSHKIEKVGIEISREEGIYVVPVNNDFLNALVDIQNVNGLQRFYVFIKYVGDRLRIIVFLRQKDVKNYLSVLFSLSSKVGIRTTLVFSDRVNDGIWEYL
ncbi:MAG: hypothetical protein LVQ96_04590 [Thermoplasmatales archaeon]|nr:hypothetical protein [Thermoplasmatales archaeon]MCW6170433.1 hypothetical protein [Thermoplasmatales archaeon]